MKFKFFFFICFCLIISLPQIVYSHSDGYPEPADERRRRGFGSILGKDKEDGAVTIFGKSLGKSGKTNKATQQTAAANDVKNAPAKKSQISQSNAYNNKKATNSYLWQAALNSVQSMPILVSDSLGGVLSTDWYENNEIANERYKFNIVIKSNLLKKNSLAVTAFKQKFEDGQWKNTKIDPEIANNMRDKILSKAKELKNIK